MKSLYMAFIEYIVSKKLFSVSDCIISKINGQFISNTGFGIFLFFICTSTNLYSQGEIDDETRIFYRNEKSAAIQLNSTGLGINLRYGNRIDARNKTLYDIDFAHVKHPKEIKVTNPYYPNARSFVYGKLHNFYTIRVSIGKQHEMFRKLDKGGIAIRYFYNLGVTGGLLKPIYYEVYDFNLEQRVSKKFEPTIHQSEIGGRSAFTKGMNEIGIRPGGFGKFGINFEYSTVDELIHALEVGIQLDAFLQKIPIMATDSNNQFFLSFFVAYRFGRIIDPLAGRNRSVPSGNQYYPE